MRIRLTLSRVMIVTGVLGTAAGLLARAPRLALAVIASPILPIVVASAVGPLIYFVARLRPKCRLAVESATLVALLGLSAVTWNPYDGEERCCLELAQEADAGRADTPAIRRALDREAAWFRGRAAELRRRGLWLGLTMRPKTRDEAAMGSRSLTYELATAESMEKHEKAVRRLIATRSPPAGSP